MMNAAQLEALGLSVRSAEAGLEADLELEASLVNPITRAQLQRVTFRAEQDALVPVAPPELAWIPPVPVAEVERAAELEKRVTAAFDEYVFTLQRRSTELQAMGLTPHVDPSTLELSADLKEGGELFVLAADRRGNFEVVRANRNGEPLEIPAGHTFELSEYRDKGALVAWLGALASGQRAPGAAAPPAGRPIRFSEVAEKLHPEAVIPPMSALEVLLEVEVTGQRYRFAAARVTGRSFRGLLAGQQGKVWSGRFELDSFPGVVTLVSKLLGVPAGQVQVHGVGKE